MSNDRRVAAIRRDPKVGRGSNSIFEDYWTDEDLEYELKNWEWVKTPRDAVEWAHRQVRADHENALFNREPLHYRK